jgi:hypothetical protein
VPIRAQSVASRGKWLLHNTCIHYCNPNYDKNQGFDNTTGHGACKVETISFSLAQDGHILGHSLGMCPSLGSNSVLVKRPYTSRK